MATVNCLRCQKPFTPKRSTAKFCSDSCKVLYNRKKNHPLFNLDEERVVEGIKAARTQANQILAEEFIPRLSNRVLGLPEKGKQCEYGQRLMDWCVKNIVDIEAVFPWLDKNYPKPLDHLKKPQKNESGAKTSEVRPVSNYRSELFKKKNEPSDEKPEPVSQEPIEKQLSDLRAAKIPDHIKTELGRKCWKFEQMKKIMELEARK